jgi:predicted RNA polymerase sigma factor
MTGTPDAHDIGELLRELAPQVLGALVHRYGQFGACEDAVADAVASWPARRGAGEPEGLAAHRRLPPPD